MKNATIAKRDEFLVFALPLIEDDEIEEVVKTLKSGWLGSGPKVAQFEEDFKQYKDADYAVALSSCTAALHLSLIAAGITAGDEVITTPLTFCATVNAIIHAGGTPVLADIDPHTLNIDPKEILKKVTSKTKAIIPVHFAGRACEMDEIMDIAKQHKLIVIEDCAHAIETEYKNQKAGNIGDFGCFSFYVTKNIVTGEGGMVLTPNKDYASRIKTLGLHGMTKDAWKRFGDDGYKHYQVVECGFKYNMMDLQASIGIHQLKKVDKYWDRREEIWFRYLEELKNLPITLPMATANDTKHGYHLFTVLLEKEKCGYSRDEFIEELKNYNIGIGVHYMSIPEHPYYQDTFGWKPESTPHAMNAGRNILSLPLSAKLTDQDVSDVINAIRSILDHA
ncbi:DegT/DnrJ/EryC1/StrS family aminotransferase [Mucilaginibacter sp. UYCu711]|uniref:DegT/DnrJ/EryC1/StrS family aminotransferase n=1 Tax=Mucilaginibacter sp. UYCu711 TaxID=3156339 RepID=UPI003D2595C1